MSEFYRINMPRRGAIINMRLAETIVYRTKTNAALGSRKKPPIITRRSSTRASPRISLGRSGFIRRAIGQLDGTNFEADAAVLNPDDWTAMELLKDDEQRYLRAV